MAIGSFGFTEQRCSVTVCIATAYVPTHFFSKFPGRVSPIWNLAKLFPPLIWVLVFVSIILVTLMFQFSSYIYQKMGLRKSIISEEMVLIPLR